MPEKPSIAAVVVCVDYADILAITAPLNLPLLSRLIVVTAITDHQTRDVAHSVGAEVVITDAFYENGAAFNRGAAVEAGLCVLATADLILILDADVIIPPALLECDLSERKLYGTPRRILSEFTAQSPELLVPYSWDHLPVYPDSSCPFGYFQLFHSDDPVLKQKPWYSVRWRHCGGSDDDFRKRWLPGSWSMLPFNVLHLGEPSVNWCGRVTKYVDGKVPELAEARKQLFKDYHSGERSHFISGAE